MLNMLNMLKLLIMRNSDKMQVQDKKQQIIPW